MSAAQHEEDLGAPACFARVCCRLEWAQGQRPAGERSPLQGAENGGAYACARGMDGEKNYYSPPPTARPLTPALHTTSHCCYHCCYCCCPPPSCLQYKLPYHRPVSYSSSLNPEHTFAPPFLQSYTSRRHPNGGTLHRESDRGGIRRRRVIRLCAADRLLPPPLASLYPA